MGSQFCVLRGHRAKFLNHDAFMFLKIGFIIVNNADPDENATFHLGLHCLPKNIY